MMVSLQVLLNVQRYLADERLDKHPVVEEGLMAAAKARPSPLEYP